MIKLFILIFIGVICCSCPDGDESCESTTGGWPGKDCVKNADGTVRDAGANEDPNTIFSCTPEQSCCTKNLLPACCGTKPMGDAIQEQIALWGSVLGIVLFLGLFIWFCRSDQSLLDAETPCLQKFCPCKFPRRGDDGHLHNKPPFGSTASLQSEKSGVMFMEDEEGVEHIEDDAANLEAVLSPGDEGDTLIEIEETPPPPPEEPVELVIDNIDEESGDPENTLPIEETPKDDKDDTSVQEVPTESSNTDEKQNDEPISDETENKADQEENQEQVIDSNSDQNEVEEASQEVKGENGPGEDDV